MARGGLATQRRAAVRPVAAITARVRLPAVDWTRSALEARLKSYQPKDPSDLLVRDRAAVASVLRFDDAGAQVLLMQRATREGDRWSGQVSFPGGRAEPEDPDLLATAIRETREEVGLDLRQDATLLGRLDALRAIARGRLLSMTITPYVFVLERERPFTLSEEAESVFWLPLHAAAKGELDATYDWRSGPLSMALPAWTWQDRTVWGLTFQMLTSLVDVARGPVR